MDGIRRDGAFYDFSFSPSGVTLHVMMMGSISPSDVVGWEVYLGVREQINKFFFIFGFNFVNCFFLDVYYPGIHNSLM